MRLRGARSGAGRRVPSGYNRPLMDAILEREIKRVKRGRFILLPISDQTRGHGTHSVASLWKQYLAELLEASK